MDPISIIGFAAVATAGFCVKLHELYQKRLHRATIQEAEKAKQYRLEIRRKYVNKVVQNANRIVADVRLRQRQFVDINPPEINRLNQLLQHFKADEFKWDAIIAMGDIYRRGAFPRFLPNNKMAIDIYKIAAMCPDGDIAGTGQLKYIETRTEMLSTLDLAGKPLPIEQGLELCRIAQLRIQGTPAGSFQKPKNKRRQTEQSCRRIGQETRLPETHPGLADLPIQQQVQQINIPEYMIDAQNVHDHAVVKITKHNLKQLKEGGGQEGQFMTEVSEAIVKNQHLGKGPLADAMTVLKSISSEYNKSLGTSEQEALALVWNKIQSQPPELRNNLTETLVKQLASGVEYGHVVCSTGKITRISSVLETLEDGTKVKPTWALRDELAILANKIRDKHINQLNDENKTAYNEGKLSNVEETMKKEFEHEAQHTYCKELGMDWTILSPIVEQLTEGF